jgi:hypothetical protein
MFLGGLRGAKLYNETNIYKATKTALALAAMYPEPSLAFKNPVLSAFANAVWHCSSAAQVCIVLNEAMAHAPQTEEDAEHLSGLLKAFQEANKKPPKRLPEMTPATYVVVYSDGRRIEKCFVPMEIDEWIVRANADLDSRGECRIVRIIDANGKIVWGN